MTLNRSLASRVARFLLIFYVVSLTIAVALAVTVGPFRESYRLWTRANLLERGLNESNRERRKLEEERDRLLKSVKNLQADWTSSQETIRALRELTKNPDMEQKLVEANRLAEKLSLERTVLITKLNELRLEIQTLRGSAGAPPANSPPAAAQ